ncbi:MAG: FAD-dependent oxidoreductase, partial [Mesorhizobium sp.]
PPDGSSPGRKRLAFSSMAFDRAKLGGREWMGYRPSLPDSLPVIGRARAPNIFYAFGHGHLGLTQAAATGRLIRDLVLGQTPPVDLAPFGPQRF